MRIHDLGTTAIHTKLNPKTITGKLVLLTMKDLPIPCYSENIWKN